MYSVTDDGRLRLDIPLNYQIWLAPGVEFCVTVPAGFESDGASIPAPFWWLTGPPIRDKHLVPAIVHDYLCDTARDRSERLIADAVFRKLLAEKGVSKTKQFVFWVGVYLQGRFLWVPKVAAVLLALCLLFALLGFAPAKKELPEPRVVIGSCKIDRIIDADTADLSVTRIVRVRFLNCWAPETRKTKHPSEKHLGQLAMQYLEGIAHEGAECRLEMLPDGDEDIGDDMSFGRVAGNVYLEHGDGRSLNEIMNASGLTYPTKAELEAYLTAQDAEVAR